MATEKSEPASPSKINGYHVSHTLLSLKYFSYSIEHHNCLSLRKQLTHLAFVLFGMPTIVQSCSYTQLLCVYIHKGFFRFAQRTLITPDAVVEFWAFTFTLCTFTQCFYCDTHCYIFAAN